MLAATPGVYKHVLKQFKLGGYYGAYGASTSPGAGINWIGNRNADYGDAKLKISANYVAKNVSITVTPIMVVLAGDNVPKVSS